MNKRFFAVLLAVLAAVAACGLLGCSSAGQGSSSGAQASSQVSAPAASVSSASAAADAGQSGKHVIGVVVYDVTDSEVLMFNQYLVDYIAKECFDDVRFVYSNSITTEDELLAFIDDVAAMGGEGIMSFFNIDLAAEVGRCAEHGMYHIVASGTVSEEDFASVEDNEYFLGAVGPMIAMEYNAGASMVRNYVAKSEPGKIFIMSGGAGIGNEMHYQRTLGMLDAIETAYGVDLGQTKELAASSENVTLETESVKVDISPGYVAIDENKAPVLEAFAADDYDVVLATIPVFPIIDDIERSNAKIAQVDCYSQENQLLFASGKLDYLVGKYGSQIGPSFVALYNAVTGHASEFREDGKAFQIVQDFWTSADAADFDEKYAFASNITTPAFNYEDLYSICSDRTPTATLDDLRDLASGSSYEEAKARRS